MQWNVLMYEMSLITLEKEGTQGQKNKARDDGRMGF